MRYEPLKRQVLIETGIAAAVLTVLVAIVFLLASIRDDYINNNQSSKRILDTIDGEYNALKTKYSFIQQNAQLYEEVKKKQESGMLSINRQSVLDKFNQYKTQFSLSNLRLSVSPIAEMKDGQYRKKTSLVTSSEVSIELEALTDERVYEMLETMQQELSGFSRISRLTLARERKLDDDVLNAIRTKGVFPLVKTGI
ncbi:MAG: hypothetical protein EBV03_07135, partial [Proteobacteria bacterium]|nr:hypothetical protein [Pseudomonadota bacterium]